MDRFIKKCNEAYFNKEQPICSDESYDLAIEKLEEIDPNNELLKHIGTVPNKNKVKLPYHMGSMNKYKSEKQINTWRAKYKGPYIISSKLDGISALYISNVNSDSKLYTRGNGTIGQDISHLIPYLNLPKLNQSIVLRGELIISKQKFLKHSNKFSSGRSFINSMISKNKIDKSLISNIDYVIFEEIAPYSLLKQYEKISSLNFKVVQHMMIETIDYSSLETLLDKFKDFSAYEIDGIIVHTDNSYDRNVNGNPNYAFAFKKNPNGEITTVTNVLWNVSKHGKIVPKIEFTPVILNGSKVKYATGTHAKYINENNINKGTIIRVVLSGDVIPAIVEILEPSPTPLMPVDIDDYFWDVSNTNIYVKNDHSQAIKKIEHFFKTLGLDNVGPGIIHKLYDHGFQSIDQYKDLQPIDIISIDGIQEKSAKKIVSSFQHTFANSYNLSTIAHASMEFGEHFGPKKLELIESHFPEFHKKLLAQEEIESISGMGPILSKQFIKLQSRFIDFIKNHSYLNINAYKGKPKSFKYVFSGFRHPSLKKKIETQYDVEVVDTMTKDVKLLVVKDVNKLTSKTKYAKKNNIKIISLSELLKISEQFS